MGMSTELGLQGWPGLAWRHPSPQGLSGVRVWQWEQPAGALPPGHPVFRFLRPNLGPLSWAISPSTRTKPQPSQTPPQLGHGEWRREALKFSKDGADDPFDYWKSVPRPPQPRVSSSSRWALPVGSAAGLMWSEKVLRDKKKVACECEARGQGGLRLSVGPQGGP